MACVFPPKKNIKELMDPLMKNQATIRAYAMLRRFIGQCVLLIAPKEIVMIEDEDLLTYLKPVLTPSDTKMIPKGVTIKVKVPMKDNMKECAPDVQFGAEVPDIFPLNIAVANTGLRFTYPDKFKTDLPSLLKCADPMIAATLPNQIFPKTNMPFDVQECTLSRDFKRFQIVLKGPYKIVGDAIKLGDIKLAVQKVGDKPMTFIGLTTVNIGSFTCQVTLTKQDKAYTFKGIIESFNLGMLRFLVGDNDIGKIASMFDALKNIAIKDFTWIVNFGSSNMLR